MTRAVLILVMFAGVACSSRRAVPVAQNEKGSAASRAGVSQAAPGATDRIVRLSSTISDTSCLDRRGGTAVAAELSDDDVRRIEALIREVDTLPIVRIGHPTFGMIGVDAGGPEFEGMTGVECGPLSGHGTIYRIVRVGNGWRVTRTGDWVA